MLCSSRFKVKGQEKMSKEGGEKRRLEGRGGMLDEAKIGTCAVETRLPFRERANTGEETANQRGSIESENARDRECQRDTQKETGAIIMRGRGREQHRPARRDLKGIAAEIPGIWVDEARYIIGGQSK